jgi:transposase-like protein
MAAKEEVKKKHFSAEGKLQIVKAHLIDGIPVSKLGEQHQINKSSQASFTYG